MLDGANSRNAFPSPWTIIHEYKRETTLPKSTCVNFDDEGYVKICGGVMSRVRPRLGLAALLVMLERKTVDNACYFPRDC